jgi:hypothetical protein
MSKLELNQIYLQLEREINLLSQSTPVVYRDSVRADAQHAITEFKNDIDSWVIQLNERAIACYDLEDLLESKRDIIQLRQLESKDVDGVQIEKFKSDILRMIAKAIMNTYLETLFRNQNRKKHEGDDLFEG